MYSAAVIFLLGDFVVRMMIAWVGFFLAGVELHSGGEHVLVDTLKPPGPDLVPDRLEACLVELAGFVVLHRHLAGFGHAGHDCQTGWLFPASSLAISIALPRSVSLLISIANPSVALRMFRLTLLIVSCSAGKGSAPLR